MRTFVIHRFGTKHQVTGYIHGDYAQRVGALGRDGKVIFYSYRPKPNDAVRLRLKSLRPVCATGTILLGYPGDPDLLLF